jgi:hypothetical protein
MGQNLVPNRPPLYARTERGDDPGCFNAERHRRCPPHVPITYADDIVPVAHAGRLDLQQHLAFARRARFGDLKGLHGATEPLDPRNSHSASIVACPTPATAAGADLGRDLQMRGESI